MKLRSIIFMTILSLATALSTQAAPPQTMNYQGYLTNSAGNSITTTSPITIVFSLYNTPTGGSALWTETQNVTVSNGLYNVILGSVTPINLPFDVQYYLGIKVGADSEMTPRGTLTSSPYAFRAATVQTDNTPIGSIIMFGGDVAPAGWLICDGSSVLRTQYPALFLAINTNFGSVDGTHFNLPDLRGVFPRGAGVNGTQLKATGAAMNGGVVGAKLDDKMQGHYHDLYQYTAQASHAAFNESSMLQGTTAALVTAPANPVRSPSTDGQSGTPRTGDETAPASLSVNYIIKY